MGLKKTEQILIRVSHDEKREIENGAKLCGLSKSAMMVSSTLKEVRNMMKAEIIFQNEVSNQSNRDAKLTIQSQDERIQFIAEMFGIPSENLSREYFKPMNDAKRLKMAMSDFRSWSKKFTQSIQEAHGEIPTNEEELIKYIKKIGDKRD
jgi:uncharacterized protein (DUF1778 family)